MAISKYGIETANNDWLIVPGTVAENRTKEVDNAIRLLVDYGALVPIPQPAVAIWKSEDEARIERNLRLLGKDQEETGAVTGLRDVPQDSPDTAHLELLTDMADRLTMIRTILDAPLP